jgi:acetylornithine deacetylase
MPDAADAAATDCVKILSSLELNEGRFMSLLEKLIGESEFLQNSPPQGLIPCEDKASNHVLAVLEPFMIKNGGVLEVERVSFVEGS